jgi:hypothetical protein
MARSVPVHSRVRNSVALMICVVTASAFVQRADTQRESSQAETHAKTLRIAIVQMRSLDHNIDGNLTRATQFAEQAQAEGATLVLYPEFMPTGSYLSRRTHGIPPSRAMARPCSG